MREELIEGGADPLSFVGSCGDELTPTQAADAIRHQLDLESNWASRMHSWTDALRQLRNRIEAMGVLVVFNGIVGNNTYRKLDRYEFQGFTLVDSYAPLVFVNSTDFKTAQIFTLTHELAHVFSGTSGVVDAAPLPAHHMEQRCNSIAAEFLLPAAELVVFWERLGTIEESLERVAKHFKVSVLVAAYRTLNLRLIGKNELALLNFEWVMRGEG